MDKNAVFSKVKSLYFAIINGLDIKAKEKRDYYVIEPNFSIPNQISSKEIKKQGYMTFIFFDIVSLKKYSEYCELFKYLKESCSLNQTLIEKLILDLCNTMLSICREKDCEKDIEKFIDLFYNDLVKTPIKYYIKGFLTGLSLEDEIYKIDENLSLRKAKSYDFESKNIGEFNNKLNYYTFQFPPVIMDYKFLSNRNIDNNEGYSYPPELAKELSTIDWALLLFRSAPVFRIKTESEIQSFIVRGKSISSGLIHIGTAEKYNINKNNISDLKRIISLFRTPEIQKIFEIPMNKPNHINIALNRYYNSYLYSENLPQKISSLISCLEALLSEGAQELKRSLSQRVSIILKAIGFNPLIVNKHINLAYNIRNNYNHGSVINLKKIIKQKESEFIKNLIEYTRLSFLISMQIYPLKSKKEYLKLIDDSLLDENSYLKLVKLISDNCIIFKE